MGGIPTRPESNPVKLILAWKVARSVHAFRTPRVSELERGETATTNCGPNNLG